MGSLGSETICRGLRAWAQRDPCPDRPPGLARLGAGAGNLQIQKGGSVVQDGQVLGALTLADWSKPEALEKILSKMIGSTKNPKVRPDC